MPNMVHGKGIKMVNEKLREKKKERNENETENHI